VCRVCLAFISGAAHLCVCVCVCVLYPSSQRHTLHNMNKHAHTHTHILKVTEMEFNHDSLLWYRLMNTIFSVCVYVCFKTFRLRALISALSLCVCVCVRVCTVVVQVTNQQFYVSFRDSECWFLQSLNKIWNHKQTDQLLSVCWTVCVCVCVWWRVTCVCVF